jgi:hypothetical protein
VFPDANFRWFNLDPHRINPIEYYFHLAILSINSKVSEGGGG